MVFARLSRFYSFQLQHILLLSVISLLQLLLGSCASTKGYFESKKTSSWGVHVKRHKKDFSIIMKSDVVGQLPQKAYELGDYLPIAESGMFELGVVPVIYDGINQFNELSPCIEEFSKIEFARKAKKLASFLEPISSKDKVLLTILPIPADTEFHRKETIRFNGTIPIRLVFPVPSKQMICNKWWSKAITILVHEFVHAYDEITKFPTTNDVSAEVIAYSVTYCVALSNATPDKVFPVWEIGKNNFQFEQVYAGFISGKLMESGSAWAAKVPTLLGNNLALLQFFHLFNDAFPQEPTQTELNDVAKYCKYVISQPHDYLKTSYFNRQKTEPTFIKNLRSGIYIPVTIIK